MMKPGARIFVAGHNGLVGSAVVRHLEAQDFESIITCNRAALDLTDARAVDSFFEQQKPEYVVLAAAKVGGIKANDTQGADFIRINLQIQTNIIDASHRHGVTKLLHLGSSCIYPKLATQPLREESLLSGYLEPTNKPYAVAKIAGIIMCEAYNRQYGTNFIAAMPTNLYGPGDHFDLQTSHVLPALIRKFHTAMTQNDAFVELWGTGNPKREFLYIDDLAQACIFMLHQVDATPLQMMWNVGIGEDVTIRDLAQRIRTLTGFPGDIRWNHDMPDGTPRKLLDVSQLRKLGWQAKISLGEGLQRTYDWYVLHAT